ncbi:hypothetical protein [Azospirillum sp. B2RO_4]|uniref:hypothetical protein n=1 Tax=Azospirillum sp. B2RO_4 TaxID=3027796 RepID=UPI003DA8DEE7
MVAKPFPAVLCKALTIAPGRYGTMTILMTKGGFHSLSRVQEKAGLILRRSIATHRGVRAIPSLNDVPNPP